MRSPDVPKLHTATVEREPDYVAIGGTRIDLDAIVNPLFLRATERLENEFARNQPFPHVVIDGLFSPELLRLAHDEFARHSRFEWDRYDSSNEVKRGSNKRTRLGPATQLYFNTIHSRSFVQFLERLSRIAGLVPDPELFAGGMHEIPDGGHFSVHVDFNRHPITRLDNRLVVITYLNEGWLPAFGGSLELWDGTNNLKVREVEPYFGRTIIFAQSPQTWHGHPTPVRAPDRRSRRSLAAYYYSNGGDGPDAQYRTTRFLPGAKRPSENRLTPYVKYCVPPFALDLMREFRRAMRSRR